MLISLLLYFSEFSEIGGFKELKNSKLILM